MQQYLNKFYLLAKFFIKNLLYFSIKFDVLLIHAFSRTILFVFYVFGVIGGFCVGHNADFSTVFLFLFVSYVSASSFLLMIVCNTKSTLSWVGRLVGVTFLERFPPKKGKTNCLILVLTLVILLSLDLVSMQFFISQDLAECGQLDESIKNLIQTGEANEKNVKNLYQTKRKILETLPNTRGILCKAHEMFPFVHIHSFFKNL